MTDSDDETSAADGADRLDRLADICATLIAAWGVFGAANRSLSGASSRVAVDVRQFQDFHGTSPANVGYAPVQLAGQYVDAITQHLAALEALIRARRLTVAPWPIVRAGLETAGRVAWLLEPIEERSGERRVARFYLELISSLQRERFTLGKYNGRKARSAATARDAKIREVSAIYANVHIDLSKITLIETWTIHAEPLLGLGDAVSLFARLCFTEARGMYDNLSDFSHPSIIALTRQSIPMDDGRVATRSWVTKVETVEWQARLACLTLYKSAHLIADYNGSDPSPLENWADTVAPVEWFNAPETASET